jgi:hypothetical protein
MARVERDSLNAYANTKALLAGRMREARRHHLPRGEAIDRGAALVIERAPMADPALAGQLAAAAYEEAPDPDIVSDCMFCGERHPASQEELPCCRCGRRVNCADRKYLRRYRLGSEPDTARVVCPRCDGERAHEIDDKHGNLVFPLVEEFQSWLSEPASLGDCRARGMKWVSDRESWLAPALAEEIVQRAYEWARHHDVKKG